MTTIIIPKVEQGRRYRLADGRQVEVLRIQTFRDRAQLGEVRTTAIVKLLIGDEWQIGRQLELDRSALAALIVAELPAEGAPPTGPEPAAPAGSEQGELL